MPDNFTFTPGTGATGAADDIGGGVLVQRVKVQQGVDGSAADVSAGAGLPIGGQYIELTGSASSATSLIASTDVRGFARFCLQLTGTFSATVRAQGSNDNTNWSDYTTFLLGSTGSPSSAGLTTAGIYTGVIHARYLRVQVTSYASGTVNAVLEIAADAGVSNVSTFVGNAVSTSLPSPSVTSDSWGNPSVPGVGAVMMAYDPANAQLARVKMPSYQGYIGVQPTPGNGGGWAVKSLTALTNSPQAVSASNPASCGGYYFYNPNAVVAYVQVFGTSAGTVSYGSTTPSFVIPIAPNTGIGMEIVCGVNGGSFVGLSVAAATTATGTTALTTALVGYMLYK